MMKRIVMLSLITITLGNAYSQKLSVPKGQNMESVINSKMNMSMDVMGQSMDNNTENNTTSEVSLKDITDTGLIFSNTIKRMVIKASTMGQEVNFDSDKKEDMDSKMGETLKDQIGNEQEITVDKQGKIMAMKSLKGKADDPIGSFMNTVGNMTKGQPYPLLIPYSGKSLKPGYTWTDSAGTVENLKTVTNYTVKEIKGDEIVLSFTGTLAKKGTLSFNGIDIDLDMAGKMSGDASYEKSSGLLKQNTTVSDAKGTAGIKGQSFDFTTTNTMVTTLHKL